MIEQIVENARDIGATSNVAAWCEALDEIEQHLDRSELFLGEITETTAGPLDEVHSSWSAPTGLGPMPAEMEGRALALLARLAQTERALSDQASLTSRRMASVNRPDPRRKTNSGSRFDSSC